MVTSGKYRERVGIFQCPETWKEGTTKREREGARREGRKKERKGNSESKITIFWGVRRTGREVFSEPGIKRTCTQVWKTSTCSGTSSEEWRETRKKIPAVLEFRPSWGWRECSRHRKGLLKSYAQNKNKWRLSSLLGAEGIMLAWQKADPLNYLASLFLCQREWSSNWNVEQKRGSE